MPSSNSVKILFRFYSDILDKETSETMWAEVVDLNKGYYKLDNTPFYAPLVASGDIVFAEFDKDELMLTYRKTVEYSGNSTIHVIVMDDHYEINTVRKIFEDLKCP